MTRISDWGRTYTAVLLPVFVLWSIGCRDLTGKPAVPAGTQDPSVYDNPAGARTLARGTLAKFRGAVSGFVEETGVLTDELVITVAGDSMDQRTSLSNDGVYNVIQDARINARFAGEVARTYAPDASAMIGELYAVEGSTELQLAEMFCSGMPLSTVDFQRDFEYQPGSTSAQVYTRAAAAFDTAATLSKDSVPLATFARVGWGRALIGLGLYDSAAHVVASVPTTGVYRIRIRAHSWSTGANTMGDDEGMNGLPFVRSNDPRTWADTATVSNATRLVLQHYPVAQAEARQTDSTTIVLASGVEARLIEAEADLRRNGTHWLDVLNALRTDGSFTITVRTNTPGVSPGPANYPDTTWGPGTGIGLIPAAVLADAAPQCEPADPVTAVVPTCRDTVWYRGLHPLTDPGAAFTGQAAIDARIDLLFRERAFWLYLTGHRQGDLRRLVRSTATGGYGRNQRRVYPSGIYWTGLPYGSTILLQVQKSERLNPKFKGCLSLDP